MALSNSHLHDPNLSAAADEVLDNATRLYLAGYFREAQAVTESLLQPGPWQVAPNTTTMARVKLLLPRFCWANGQGSPELPDEPARSATQLSRWAREENEQELDDLTLVNGGQTRAAGANWTEDYFVRLPELPQVAGVYRQYDEFVSDAHIVLKDRLRRRLNRPAPGPRYRLVNALASLEVYIAPRAEKFDHHQLSDMLALCGSATKRPPTWNEERCYVIATVLDLLGDDVTAAARHLNRLVTLGAHVNVALILTCYPPLRNLLGSGVLAGVLGLNQRTATEYVGALRSRRDAALLTDA